MGESLLPWVLFYVSWTGNAAPSARAENIFHSRERCLEAASHYHEFVGNIDIRKETTFKDLRKYEPHRSEMRCKQVDVDALLGPYARDSDTRAQHGDKGTLGPAPGE